MNARRMGGKENVRKRTARNDMLLFAGLLIAGTILLILLNAVKPEGARVDVLVDGEVAASYPLNEDREVDLGYKGHNLLKIDGGWASVTAADCPDRLCVQQRAISKEGETIVCLPHRVVIRVSGGEASDFDGVAR